MRYQLSRAILIAPDKVNSGKQLVNNRLEVEPTNPQLSYVTKLTHYRFFHFFPIIYFALSAT